MLGHLVSNVLSTDKGKKVKGKVVIMDKNVLGLHDIGTTVVNHIQDFLGHNVEVRLVSATDGDPNNGNRGLVGPPAHLEKHLLPIIPNVVAGETTYGVIFTVIDSHGIPGAIIVKNHHLAQFYLKSITIENFPGKGRIHFDCNSWVYNADKYSYDRVFFANDSYLPKHTPEPLRPYREDELRNLGGDDVNRKLEEWDRVYNYAFYYDPRNPDHSPALARTILGGSAALPYPRHGKTGPPPTKTDPKPESRLSLLDLEIYVPRDERFGHIKMADFLGHGIKVVAKDLLPMFQAVVDLTPNEFDSFKEVFHLYERGLPLPDIPLVSKFIEANPLKSVKAVLKPNVGQHSFFKLSMPKVE